MANELGWGNNQDARKYQLLNLKVMSVSSFPTPTSQLEGVIAYNTTTKQFAVCNGSAWVLPATDADKLDGNDSTFFQDLANIPNGNLAWARVSGGQAAINATKLSALAAPDAAVSMGSQRLINLAAASGSNDAIRKAEFDDLATQVAGAAAGVSYKSPVRAASTVNLTLSAPQTVDGVSLVAGDRVLVTAQTSGVNNGIYVVQAGAWTRATDADTNGELAPGTTVVVTEGTSNGDQPWYLTSDSAITIGTTAQVWNKLPYPAGEITVAGDGLDKVGSTLSVKTSTGLEIISDNVVIKRGTAAGSNALTTDARVPLMRVVDITGAASSTVDIAHGLGFQWPVAFVYENVSGTWGLVGGIGMEPYSTSNMRLYFGATPTDGQYKVVFYG